VPVIFDGEDYLLAGYGVGGSAVDIVHLPSPSGIGGPSVRGIGRTLRLFIYKRLGRHTTDIGLRRAELRGVRDVVYMPVVPDQFRPGHRVALFIHGFTSDTRWMIRYPAQFLRADVCEYDHFLTWDYETFGTGVESNGEQLALALRRQCGFSPEDQVTVDVYTHSMGALVARCAIELHGASAIIDRLIMAGPPNHGSTLATTGRGLIFLVTTLLNRAPLVPFLGLTNWTLKQLYEQSAGLADLDVHSPILSRLNALTAPSNVPYLVLAGENLPDPEERNRLDRLARKILDKGLDAMFGEQNDIAVGLSSLRGVRGGSYPRLRTEILPCDHFHYYVAPEAKQAIKDWLTTTR